MFRKSVHTFPIRTCSSTESGAETALVARGPWWPVGASALTKYALAALFGLIAGAALAVEPDEVLIDPALEARARDLSAGLRCLVCQNQSIDDSNAPLARDLRLLVRERLKAGLSDKDIEEFIVTRYGDFVLLKPRLTAGTLFLWLTPFLLLSMGGYALLVRRKRAEAPLERELSHEEERVLCTLGANADDSPGPPRDRSRSI